MEESYTVRGILTLIIVYPVVRALALRSGDHRFKTCCDHSMNLFQLDPGSKFLAALVNSQLVCLQPVGISMLGDISYYTIDTLKIRW